MGRILKDYEINPDGVHIHIEWSRFVIGASFFIPCINTDKAIRQITKIVGTMEAQIRYTVRAEGGKWGVRVWRTL